MHDRWRCTSHVDEKRKKKTTTKVCTAKIIFFTRYTYKLLRPPLLPCHFLHNENHEQQKTLPKLLFDYRQHLFAVREADATKIRKDNKLRKNTLCSQTNTHTLHRWEHVRAHTPAHTPVGTRMCTHAHRWEHAHTRPRVALSTSRAQSPFGSCHRARLLRRRRRRCLPGRRIVSHRERAACDNGIPQGQ